MNETNPSKKELIDLFETLGYNGLEYDKPIANAGQSFGSSDIVSHTSRWHLDRRGGLVELYRRSWAGIWHEEKMRQCYISTTHQGVVKGWHVHPEQTDRFFAVRGAVMLVMADLRREHKSGYVSIVLDSRRAHRTVLVPPGVAHGWVALEHADGEAWILNMCSHEYDGTGEFRKPAMEAPCHWLPPYDWFKVPSV